MHLSKGSVSSLNRLIPGVSCENRLRKNLLYCICIIHGRIISMRLDHLLLGNFQLQYTPFLEFLEA